MPRVRHHPRELCSQRTANFNQEGIVRLDSGTTVTRIQLDQHLEISAVFCNRSRKIDIISDKRNRHTAIDELCCAVKLLRRLRCSDENVPESVVREIFRLGKCRNGYSAGLARSRHSRDFSRLRCLEVRAQSDTVPMNGVAHSFEISLENPLVENKTRRLKIPERHVGAT